MLGRRFNSNWSSVTSLWNRIRGASKVPVTESNAISNPANASKTPAISSSPWLHQSVKKTPEPLNQFWIRTGMFRVSSQKLNLLGRQISRLSVPQAILQMKFSPKRAAREIHSLLLQAQSRILAAPEKADANAFVIQQAVIGKGTYLKRIDIKGRGKHGVIWRPHSFLRLQVGIPNEDVELKKQFKLKIRRENKPVMLRLDY